MNKFFQNIFLLVVFLLGARLVFAYDLTLTKIGTMSTIGADYSLVSYTGSVPGFEGTATPAATVTIKVNTTSANVLAATTSGIWTFTPASLNSGDNTIVVTSGTQAINFIVRYNSTGAPTPTASSSGITTLPKTGTWENIVYGAMAGIAILFFGRYIKREMYKWEGK